MKKTGSLTVWIALVLTAGATTISTIGFFSIGIVVAAVIMFVLSVTLLVMAVYLFPFKRIRKTERSMKELLSILLKTYQDLEPTSFGLCATALRVFCDELGYNEEELSRVTAYIKDNRPQKGNDYYDESHKNSSWYWSTEDQKSRIGWLKQQIRKQR